MKQVKKLLVILPLVALFVLGSLPVFALVPNTVIFEYDGQKITKDDQKVEVNTPAAVYDGTKFTVTDTLGVAVTSYTATPAATAPDGSVEISVTDGTNTFKFKLVPKKTAPAKKCSLDVVYYENMEGKGTGKEFHRIYNLPEDFLQKAVGEGNPVAFSLENLDRVQAEIKKFVENQLQDGYRPIGTTYRDAANTLLTSDEVATVRMGRPASRRRRVIAYDIHFNHMPFDQVSEVELDEDYESTVGIVEAFYNHAEIRNNYILVGYVRRGEDPVITNSIASLEKIDTTVLRNTMGAQYVNAEYAALVVPNGISVPVEHIFPEGTRDLLRERVTVPYATWVTLQNTWRLVDIPSIFRTRIQKINEEGYAFKSMEYYNGLTKITGLVASWDWANYYMGSDENDQFVARIYYDRAVAAAKEVPSEKKVDAATAPQAQVKAPAAQAPVAAANVATTTAPTNTLPVTGASDSIFLFLSSAALMAVGILFFKKH